MNSLDVAIVKASRVQALDESGKATQTWSAFEWLGWSHRTTDKTYLLQGGTFFEVDRKLEHVLDKYINKNKGTLPSKWPDWTTKKFNDHEDVYNKLFTDGLREVRQASRQRSTAQALLRTGALEVCDILVSGDRLQFVAVKKYAGSAPLSHLVAQGLNGVIAVLDDESLRTELADKLDPKHSTYKALSKLIPSTTCVCVVILTPDTRRPLDKLPFFAKLSIVRAMKESKMRGVEMIVGTRSFKTTQPSKLKPNKVTRGRRS